jgi:hypothetical protein
VTPEDKEKWKKALDYQSGGKIRHSNWSTMVRKNLSLCLTNCGHVNYSFNWDGTPQGTEFWHKYYMGGSPLEGGLLLKEVMAEFCEEMKLEDFI